MCSTLKFASAIETQEAVNGLHDMVLQEVSAALIICIYIEVQEFGSLSFLICRFY